ncbi:MAG TPA: Gfo/Idh/MocA family oxidoreductase [Clostridiaceae bacterium]|nr:Gfo/Idh/MocA family oxidoreductase [Clostridiaceae bacterium]
MLNFAIIGCGRISYNHFVAAIDNQLNIVAVCDVVPEMMTEKSEKYNLDSVKQYTDYKEMIEKEDIDLIAICTESGKHGEIGLYCLEKNIHLIIEKPIALSLAEADQMIDLAREKELVLCSCHQNRFNKSISKIREALEEGRFGKLFHGAAHVRWNRGKDYYEQAAWRGTWEQDGGALMNQCLHNIDLLHWMMGDIDEVFAYTDQLNHDYLEAEDLGLAIVKFSNGSYGIIEGTTNVYPKNLEETLYIFGSDGTVKAGGKSVNIIEEWSFKDGLDDPEQVKEEYHENPPNVYGFGHTPLYADVIDAITNKRQPYVDGKAGRDALELVLAIYKSAATGKPVQLPMKECSTLDFKGRFD